MRSWLKWAKWNGQIRPTDMGGLCDDRFGSSGRGELQ